MKYLVFDVESIGLHGEGFAVGGVVVEEFLTLDYFMYACPSDAARGNEEGHLRRRYHESKSTTWLTCREPLTPDEIMTREEARELLREHGHLIGSDYKLLIQAWADGLEIWLLSGDKDAYCFGEDISFTHPPSLYRIAPKPMEVWLNVYPERVSAHHYSSPEESDSCGSGRIARVHLKEVGREDFKK